MNDQLDRIIQQLDIITQYLGTIDIGIKSLNAKLAQKPVISPNALVKDVQKSLDKVEKSQKVSVQQNIYYKSLPEGQNAVGLAQVKIFIGDSDKEFKKTIMTDPHGQWKCANLPLGKYRISIVKQAIGEKPAIVHSFFLDLDGTQSSPLKLDPLSL